MNKFVTNIITALILIFAQGLFFNNINFLGSINPFVYVFFIAYFPLKNNRTFFIFCSFFDPFYCPLPFSRSRIQLRFICNFREVCWMCSRCCSHSFRSICHTIVRGKNLWHPFETLSKALKRVK